MSLVTFTVFIVDSDADCRDRLAAIVRTAGWQPVLFGTAEELLADPRSMDCGCVVSEVELPGMSGLELQRRLAERAPLAVVFVSACRDIRSTVRALKAGAVNFLAKPVNPQALASAIAEALEHSRIGASREAQRRALHSRFAELTARERQVMELVVSGLHNREVADGLGIAETTAKVHRGRVMSKMGAASLAQLVRLGAKLGVGSVALTPDANRGRWYPPRLRDREGERLGRA